jgi:iron complex outermembrane recepter protein
MISQQLFLKFSLAGIALLMTIQPVSAQTVPLQSAPLPESIGLDFDSPVVRVSQATPITNVQVNLTSEGLDLVFQTGEGVTLQPSFSQDGSRLVIDIPEAQLSGDSVAAENLKRDRPIGGIETLEMTQVGSTIRITVTGTTAAPRVNWTAEAFGGRLSLVPVVETAEAPETAAPETAAPETAVPEPLPDAIRIIVTGDRETYRVAESSVGTRTDADIRDIPQSIQVIPQQVLEDQGIQEVGDALRNVSGVVQAERASTPLPGFAALIRGFESNNVLRNGLRDTNARFATVEDNIERLEILKGPASVLFGQGNLGGTINVVTEVPLDEPAYALEYTAGQFGQHRFAVDFSSPFDTEDPLGLRFNASYELSQSFRDGEKTELLYVAPTVQLIATDNTDLLVDLEYIKFRSFGTAPELPAVGTILDNPNGEVDRNVNLGEPSLTEGEDTITRLGYRLEQRLSDDWKLRNEFLFSRRESQSSGVTPFVPDPDDDPIGLGPELRSLTRFLTVNPGGQTSVTLNTNISGQVNTGSIQHQLLAGVEFLSDTASDKITFNNLTPIDIFDPEYQPGSNTPFTVFQNNTYQTLATGIYIQDLINLTDNLIVLVGGRFDIAVQENEDFKDEEFSFERTDQAFSPRLGIVYQPSDRLAIYASYARSFVPVNGRNTSQDENNQVVFGEPFEPERGTQYEIGVKADLTDDLTATLALYELRRTNVVAQSSDSPLATFQVGEQRSRGIELDIAGEILPGWQVIASYAYTDAEVTKDDRIEPSNPIPNVPRHSASLWTSYEIQSGNLQGLGFGIGVFYQDDRPVDFPTAFELPSFLRTDASLFYRRDRFQATLSVQNLFDIDYFSAGRNYVRVIPGQPFSIVGNVRWEF